MLQWLCVLEHRGSKRESKKFVCEKESGEREGREREHYMERGTKFRRFGVCQKLQSKKGSEEVDVACNWRGCRRR